MLSIAQHTNMVQHGDVCQRAPDIVANQACVEDTVVCFEGTTHLSYLPAYQARVFFGQPLTKAFLEAHLHPGLSLCSGSLAVATPILFFDQHGSDSILIQYIDRIAGEAAKVK